MNQLSKQFAKEVMANEPAIMAMASEEDYLDILEPESCLVADVIKPPKPIKKEVDLIMQRRVACMRAVLTSIHKYKPEEFPVIVENALSVDESLAESVMEMTQHNIIDLINLHEMTVQAFTEGDVKYVVASTVKHGRVFQEEVWYQADDMRRCRANTVSKAIELAIISVVKMISESE